jgi:hypothetical protein
MLYYLSISQYCLAAKKGLIVNNLAGFANDWLLLGSRKYQYKSEYVAMAQDLFNQVGIFVPWPFCLISSRHKCS